MAVIGDLVATLRLDSAKFIKGIDDSRTRLQKMQRGFSDMRRELNRNSAQFIAVGAAATAGLGIMVSRTLAAQDATGKLAQQINISTSSLRGMEFAAEQTGSSAKNLSGGLEVMQKRLGELAIKGTGAAGPALEKLGIDIKDIADLRADEQFKIIADAMGGLSNQAERNAVTANIFSRANQNLVNTLAIGSDGLADMQREAEDLGITISESQAKAAADAQDAQNRMRQAFGGTANIITSALAPAVTAVSNGISINLVNSMKDGRNAATNFSSGFGDVIVTVADVVNSSIGTLSFGFNSLGLVIGGTLAAAVQRFKGNFALAERIMEDMHRDVLLAEKRFLEFDASHFRAQLEKARASAAALNDSLGGGGDDLSTSLGAVSSSFEISADSSEDFKGGLQDNIKYLQLAIDRGADYADRVRSSSARMSQLITLIATRNDLSITEIKNLKDMIELEDQLNQKLADQARSRAAAEEAAQAMRQPFENAIENIQRSWGDMFTDVFRNGVDGFKGFADTVKDIFARLAGEIVALLTTRGIAQALAGISGGFGASVASASAGSPAGAGGIGLGGLLPAGAGGILGVAGIGAGAGGLIAGLAGTNQNSAMVGAGLGAGLGYAGSSMFAGLGGLTGGIAGTLGAVGGEYLADQFGLRNPEQAGMLGGVGSAVGMAVGGPVGALVGGALGSLVGGSFGGGYDDPDFLIRSSGSASGLLGARETPFGFVGLDDQATEGLSDDTINKFAEFVQQLDVQIAQGLTETELAAAREAAMRAPAPRVSVGRTLTPDELVFAIRDRYSAILEAIGVDSLATSADPTEFAAQISQSVAALTTPRRDLAQRIQQLSEGISSRIPSLLEASRVLGSAQSTIGNFLQDLTSTAGSVLSPVNILANARARFEDVLARAKSGDAGALGEITGVAGNFLDVARENFASSPEFFQRFDFVQAELEQLQTSTQSQQDRAAEILSEIGVQIQSGDQQQNQLLTVATDQLRQLVDEMRGLSDKLERELAGA